ncbi:MAG: ImmA/IrrE family metallo-endopeptidase [Planctomycetota bacterium]|nr:ImmA/IrrE family metallo-endopeptidase [Planctomycetota bacterium]
MNNRVSITRKAIRAALTTRLQIGYGMEEPICVYECAERLGVEVKFISAPSMEGMYASAGSGVVLVSALRHSGRQAYTCAHELGHHVLGHGSRWDEYLGETTSVREAPEEWAANRFASYLLMPKQAVLRSFNVRGWKVAECTADQAVIIAGELGVGYTALLRQMELSLGLLSAGVADGLAKIALKRLRAQIIGIESPGQAVIVDESWTRKAIDIQVGDYVLLPNGIVITGDAVSPSVPASTGILTRGHRPGIAQARQPGRDWACFIRVSRREYSGRATFRHLEDPDDQ